MEHLLTTEGIISLVTLTFLEIVLGIDNVVFISILVGRLPEKHHKKARFVGIGLALVARILLLFAVSWLIGLSKPVFTIQQFALSPYSDCRWAISHWKKCFGTPRKTRSSTRRRK